MLVVCVVGLDVGVMFGFDNMKVDEEFFYGILFKLNFLVNFGYVDIDWIFRCLLWFDYVDVCQMFQEEKVMLGLIVMKDDILKVFVGMF